MPALSETPASRTITRFGGITRCARALGKPKSTVQRWKDSGFIHPDYYPDILAAAVAEGVLLDVRDFNPVDVCHPAFNAACSSETDGKSARALAALPDPKSQISESPQLVLGSGDRNVTPSTVGG